MSMVIPFGGAASDSAVKPDSAVKWDSSERRREGTDHMDRRLLRSSVD
jgi:hypothetical protein